MPRREKTSPRPWRDCPDPSCGWRNYALANANGGSSVSWAPAERCGGCGQPLRVELDRLEAKPLG